MHLRSVGCTPCVGSLHHAAWACVKTACSSHHHPAHSRPSDHLENIEGQAAKTVRQPLKGPNMLAVSIILVSYMLSCMRHAITYGCD